MWVHSLSFLNSCFHMLDVLGASGWREGCSCCASCGSILGGSISIALHKGWERALTPEEGSEWRGPAIQSHWHALRKSQALPLPSYSQRPDRSTAVLSYPAYLSVWSVGVGEGLSDDTEPSPHFRVISHSPSWQLSPARQLWSEILASRSHSLAPGSLGLAWALRRGHGQAAWSLCAEPSITPLDPSSLSHPPCSRANPTSVA